MQFEKIRRINKNKIIVGSLIGIGVIGAITILPSFAKYKVTQDINIANGVVNYKVPDLKVMAMYKSDDKTNYTEITTMPESGYVINEEKTYCTTDNTNQVKGKAYTNSSGELVFKNLTKSDKCYLYFDKYTPPITIDNIIASLNAKTTTPDFSKTATTNEGVYKVSDGMYGDYSYYWRGAVTNNYVKFANLCWRIVRINGDKTVRLIYDGTTCHANGTTGEVAVASQAYNASYDRSEYVGYTYTSGSQRGTTTASNLKTQTESWYKTNITDKGFDGKVATGKFCNDRNTASGYTWASQPSSPFFYAAYGRLSSAKTPTLSCGNASDVYSLKAGAITADEVAFAGGVVGTANSSYYLYNNQFYWAMSTFYWFYYSTSNRNANVFSVYNNGQLDSWGVNSTSGVRPVINLVSGTQFKEGTDGTQSNPYEVL